MAQIGRAERAMCCRFMEMNVKMMFGTPGGRALPGSCPRWLRVRFQDRITGYAGSMIDDCSIGCFNFAESIVFPIEKTAAIG